MFKQTGDSRYIYKNELDKACFQHDMAYGDFKDLAKRMKKDFLSKNNFFNKSPKAAVSLSLQINLLLNLHPKMNN